MLCLGRQSELLRTQRGGAYTNPMRETACSPFEHMKGREQEREITNLVKSSKHMSIGRLVCAVIHLVGLISVPNDYDKIVWNRYGGLLPEIFTVRPGRVLQRCLLFHNLKCLCIQQQYKCNTISGVFVYSSNTNVIQSLEGTVYPPHLAMVL